MQKPAGVTNSDSEWDRRSLREVHGTIPIPVGGHPWKKMLAFAGPGYLVAVGYMDPGNWATDIAGGAKFGYTLLSVIVLSNFMAILLQSLSARLGIASGRDLARCAAIITQANVVRPLILCDCHRRVRFAEVLGAAIAPKAAVHPALVGGMPGPGRVSCVPANRGFVRRGSW
jgi:manganese transport protein